MSGSPLHCQKCGSASTDTEFCSECGAAMVLLPVPGGTGAAAPANEPSIETKGEGTESCPICNEARPGPFARYCDTCRYDFLARQPFSAVSPPASPAKPPLAAPAAAYRFDLRATVDLSLRQPDDPMPADQRERVFPLDLADHLIGRRSDSADIHPEVVINDPGISRRHLRIMRAPDGTLSALDLGSMNGTRLNNLALEPNVPATLHAGDELTLGCWTRLKVEAR